MAFMQSKRITKELSSWKESPPAGLILISGDMKRWHVRMLGADGTIYFGETFDLDIIFPPEYPLEAPDVIFRAPAPEMEHVYSNGHICLSILYDEWSPALTVEKLCLSIQSMLSSATKKERPAGDADYCRRVQGKSPKLTNWLFHDDTV